MATVNKVEQWIRRFGSALALSALGLLGGPWAQAAPAPSNHWCPGDPWSPGWGTAYNWDWHQCHDWQGQAGQSRAFGSGPWGPMPGWAPPPPAPPSWAPGAQLMWNPTTGVWGFWNAGIWTPA